MEFSNKFVHFDEYCVKCKNKNTKETEDPCNECLTNPVNEHSHKPVSYEEASNQENKI